MYIQAGEQLKSPGATAHRLFICGKRIAIDSGMGIRDAKLGGNYIPVPGEHSEKLDLIIATHPHLDHTGHLPALARENPDALIIMSRPTAMGAEIMLKDSLKIHESDQKALLRAGKSATPFMYSSSDIGTMFARTRPVTKAGWCEVWPGWKFGFYSSGHTRGAMMTFIVPPKGPAYLVTGDVCSHDQPVVKGVMLPPKEFFGDILKGKSIVLITETTYGDRELDKPMEDTWNEFGEFVKRKVGERIQLLLPSFSDRAPNILKELSRRGIHSHIDGMARDFCMLHASPNYVWCEQDVILEIDDLIKQKLAVLYRKLTRGSPRGEHEAEAAHRRDTDEGNCCGIQYSPVISSSAMMDKGKSVEHAIRILPRKDTAVIFTGYMFPNSVGAKLLTLEKGDTVKMMEWNSRKKEEEARHVPVSCEVHRFALSGHDSAAKLVERVRRLNEICPVEAVIGHHGDDQNFNGFAQRVKSLNLGIPMLHGEHMTELWTELSV